MADEPISPGTLLVKLRWDKKTQAEKDRVGQMLTEARMRKRRAKRQGKVRSGSVKAGSLK